MGGWKSAYVNRWASEERMKKKRDFLKSVYVRMQKLHNATREVRNNYHLRGIAFRRRQVLAWAGNLWISVFLGLLCLTSLRRKALWRNCVFQCYNQYLRDALLACPATKRSLTQRTALLWDTQRGLPSPWIMPADSVQNASFQAKEHKLCLCSGVGPGDHFILVEWWFQSWVAIKIRFPVAFI